MSRVQYSAQELSFRQRWNNYIVLLFSLITLFGGISLRQQILTATSTYINPEVGIRAQYPQDWLIDNDGAYIFRIRDMRNIGFKTTIQLAIQAISESTTTRNIADLLTLNRSQSLAVYNVLDIDDHFILPDQKSATALSYTYVAIDTDPLLESIPVVVQGLDVLTIRRGQVIIVSFIADGDSFLSKYPDFEQFLANLDY